MNAKEIIAKRVAQELNDGDIVNLGIGLPTLVANYLPSEIDVTFQSENGFLGLGSAPIDSETDLDLINAGGQPVTMKKGGMYFDSSYSFAIIRGGHVNITVLGALQVDEKGNLANWMIPGKLTPGMGGAMDLVTGAKKVVIAMQHTSKGTPKILEECTLPLTGSRVVDMIVTEMAVMHVTDKGLELKEINPDFTIEDVQAATGANLIIPEKVNKMKI